jgi:hypothetical protein
VILLVTNHVARTLHACILYDLAKYLACHCPGNFIRFL